MDDIPTKKGEKKALAISQPYITPSQNEDAQDQTS